MYDQLSDYDFDLPENLIAQQPADPRDSARLLDASSGEYADRIMRDLPSILCPDDVLIVNGVAVQVLNMSIACKGTYQHQQS